MAIGKGYSLTDGLSQIASVLKSNGIDGELIMGFRDIDPDDINLKEPVFIIFDGLPVPFFIESFVKRGYSKALVHLTDIRTYEDAEELVGKAVYLKGEDEEENSIEDIGFQALIGWTLLTPSSLDEDVHHENEDYEEDFVDDNNIEIDDEYVNDDEEEFVDEEEVNNDEDEFDDDEDEFDDDEEIADEEFVDEEEFDNEEEVIDDEDIELEEIGKIIEYYDIPGNPCIEVETKNGAVMIPLHEDLILSIDPEYREIIMNIPEGLID